MITTTDIADIVYAGCGAFGIPLFQEGNVRKGPLTGERIVIHPKELTPGKVWRKSFVEVNFLVPDPAKDTADLIRLNALERKAVKELKGTGLHDGTAYTYSVYSTHTEKDEDLKCHFVNAKLLFQVINTLEN